MKKNLIIYTLFTLLLCSFQIYNPSDCKKIYLGQKEICLPEIEGMIECYNEKNIKPRVDEFKVKGNTIHGYYMNDSLYQVAQKNTNYITVSDCYKIYSVDETQNMAIKPSQLDDFFSQVNKTYSKNLWNEALEDFSEKHKPIVIDSPVIIDEYKPHNNIRTQLVIVRHNIDGQDSFELMTFNLSC